MAPLERNLEEWLAKQMPAADAISLVAAGEANSGFSNETRFFRLRWHENGAVHEQRLVFRWAPEGPSLLPTYNLAMQFAVPDSLAGSSVKVPRMKWLETDPSVIGRPFYVMQHVAGEVASDRAPGLHGAGIFFDAGADQRRAMWLEGIKQQALLHAIDWGSLGLEEHLWSPPNGRAAIERHIAEIESWLRFAGLGPQPTMEAAIRWLRDGLYEPSRVSLLWGDARPGNLIFRDGKAVAVIDWELASIGPPEFDLAFYIMSDDVGADVNQTVRLPGLPSEAEAIAHYEALAGVPVENYDYAKMYCALRNAGFMVLVVKRAPANLNYPADLLTNNFAVQLLRQLLDQS